MSSRNLVWLLLAVGVAIARGTSVDEWTRQGFAAEARMDPRAALDLFLKADAERPNNPIVLQKISRQYSDLSSITGTPDERRAWIERAFTYSQRAYDLAPDSAVNALSLAICHGKLGLGGSAENKIVHARAVKQYAERALALDPNYDWAHHVLGRWHAEVVALGGTRRFLVKMIYGGLPTASYDEALEHLREAVRLAPNVAAHHIELGFVLAAMGRRPEAVAQWKQGLELPSRELADEASKQRARAALAER